MTFLGPAWIALAAAASVVVAAIHLIAWRLPRTFPLPTARFVPDEPARRAARTLRLADVGLLALRMAIVMAAGVALARPVIHSTPSGRATVIAVEGSAAAGDAASLLDSLRSIPRGGTTSFVVFDTAARVVSDEAAVARLLSRRQVPEASLTVGLLAATREARRLSRDYERVDLVLVSPLTMGAFDAATIGVRGTWPDSIRVVRVVPALTGPTTNSVELTSPDDDQVLAGIRLARSNGLMSGLSRVIRETATASDTAWVDSGRVLVVWPRASVATGERVDAVHANGYTAIGHFIPLPVADSGRVAARWVNGTPAAREVPRGAGCIRTVGFDVPDVGDFVLTPSFQRLASELLAPCGGRDGITVATDSMVSALVPPPPGIDVPRATDAERAPNRVAAIVLMVAILLALVEMLVRRRYSGPASAGLAA